jgi:hypothetical protein
MLQFSHAAELVSASVFRSEHNKDPNKLGMTGSVGNLVRLRSKVRVFGMTIFGKAGD